MKQSRFFEGIVIGLLTGIVGGVVLSLATDDNKTRKKKKEQLDSHLKKAQDTTEILADKTLMAINTGFDKISAMIKQKGKNNGNI